jgi:hypothetical protein
VRAADRARCAVCAPQAALGTAATTSATVVSRTARSSSTIRIVALSGSCVGATATFGCSLASGRNTDTWYSTQLTLDFERAVARARQARERWLGQADAARLRGEKGSNRCCFSSSVIPVPAIAYRKHTVAGPLPSGGVRRDPGRASLHQYSSAVRHGFRSVDDQMTSTCSSCA